MSRRLGGAPAGDGAATAAPARSAARRAIGRGDERLGHRRVARGVPRLVDDHEAAAGPRSRQLPRDVQRAADIQAAVDEDAGDVGQPTRVAQQGPVLEPRGVAPVMGDQARERHAEPRVVVARVVAVAGAHLHVGVLPVAPVARRPRAHGGVGVGQQAAVGLDEAALPFTGRHAVAEACPLLGEQPAHVARDPADLAL